ncbi:MAG: Gfo/Idh/MocA family oxidoreductase [Oscillospiraceae bacterium]|nr:Gfo/Idh/MocA family oxidoreductase [Oscillospiraceae bacterium]
MKNSKEIRIAIIGLGMISHRHMTVIGNLQAEGYPIKVVAAAEIKPDRLKAWGEKYGLDEKDLYTDFREMLKRDDIDEVEVCVHNNLHTSVATAVMAAGFPCYSEKPMACSYADAKILYDAQKLYGQKLAIQISSIYNPQTRIAKKMVADGALGKIYHARSVGHRRQGRPGYDMPFFSPDFLDPKIGVHGPLFDLGIYHLAQMLYILGMPELESVYGFQSCDYWTNPAIDKLVNRTVPVEDLGVGLARFKGGLCMDIYEDWAIHMDDIGTSFIAGKNGGLKLIDVDTTGGPRTVPANGIIVGGGKLQLPRLVHFGIDENNIMFENKIDCAIGDITGQQELLIHPELDMYNDNQLHWYSYLWGDLTDETRVDSPYIAMQTAFLSEGVVLSSDLGRSVTADEIRAMSKSIAIREQETGFGTIKYDFAEYKPE